MWSIRTILHPTDFSAASESALRLACSLATQYQAQLVIIHVIRASLAMQQEESLPDRERPGDEFRKAVDRKRIPADQVDVVRRWDDENPTVEILHLAQLCRADLIVMGTNGHRGLKRWLMGSVAEDVSRKALCPVLTVTGPAATASPASVNLELSAAPSVSAS